MLGNDTGRDKKLSLASASHTVETQKSPKVKIEIPNEIESTLNPETLQVTASEILGSLSKFRPISIEDLKPLLEWPKPVSSFFLALSYLKLAYVGLPNALWNAYYVHYSIIAQAGFLSWSSPRSSISKLETNRSMLQWYAYNSIQIPNRCLQACLGILNLLCDVRIDIWCDSILVVS